MTGKTRSASASTPAWLAWHDPEEEIRVGVSSCLLGHKVRFDGGHKHDRYLTGVLGEWVKWVPVCPEFDIGLGIPRPTIRLEGTADDARLIEPKGGVDLTDKMTTYARAKVDELLDVDLDGYVLKKGSPSCGMERVRVYGKGGMPMSNGVGTFARVLMDRWPDLPVEEEGRLNDPRLRENFIERVFSRNRWRQLVRRGLSRGRLVEFHTANKLLLRSHNEAGYRRLGRIVASAGTIPDRQLFDDYAAEFFKTLQWKTSPKRHTNVLFHILGYLKRVLTPAEKQEMVGLIEDYRNELVPLVVPVTLFRHLVHRHGIDYMRGQLYLEPHPKELMLRNRV
jgi:uncharacterized protein YbgA (DUF1722 family)/uncharacterized protein YbbK (DUF523 family)